MRKDWIPSNEAARSAPLCLADEYGPKATCTLLSVLVLDSSSVTNTTWSYFVQTRINPTDVGKRLPTETYLAFRPETPPFIPYTPSKTNVAFAGMGPVPFSPYASAGGIVNLLLPPTCCRNRELGQDIFHRQQKLNQDS